jgi:hypothetical protein
VYAAFTLNNTAWGTRDANAFKSPEEIAAEAAAEKEGVGKGAGGNPPKERIAPRVSSGGAEQNGKSPAVQQTQRRDWQRGSVELAGRLPRGQQGLLRRSADRPMMPRDSAPPRPLSGGPPLRGEAAAGRPPTPPRQRPQELNKHVLEAHTRVSARMGYDQDGRGREA